MGECKLGDVLELKLSDGNIPVYGSGGIMRYFDTLLYDKESILIPRKSTLNNIFYLNEKQPFWTVDTIFWSKINTELTFGKFLFYYLLTIDLANLNVGSVVPSLTTKVLNEVDISLPPLKEQKAIAGVLSSLDDKIDLLHRQNKTLEEVTLTLFRQWFIEEVKEGWKTCKLSDIAVMQNGFSFSSKHYVPYEQEHLEVLKMGHIERGGELKLNPKKDFVPRKEKLEKWILNKNDIVMAMTDMKDNVVILGVPAIIDKSNKYVLNQRVARIYLKSNDKLLNNYLLYIQLKDPDFIALLQSKANSGVQVNLSTQTIKDSEVIIPPMDIQETVGKDITDLYLKKENNNIQIKTIENMRDTLLPKLMSGEVRINNER